MKKVLLEMELKGLPPTVNHLYRSTIGGRRYKTDAGREYQQMITNDIIEVWGDRQPYTGSVALYIEFETDNRRRWDIDNRVKALQDCLTMAGVIADDRQVDVLHVERRQGTTARTILTVMEANNETLQIRGKMPIQLQRE